MSFKPPKEFGEPSPFGLSQIRALDQVDVPFLKSIVPGVRSYKRGEFREVWNEQPTESLVGLTISNGKLGAGLPSATPISTAVSTTPTFRREFKQTDLQFGPDPDLFVDNNAVRPIVSFKGKAVATYAVRDLPYSAHPIPGRIDVIVSSDIKTSAIEFDFSITRRLAAATGDGEPTARERDPGAVSHLHTVREDADTTHRFNVAGSALFDLTALSMLPLIYVRNEETWQLLPFVTPHLAYDHSDPTIHAIGPDQVLMVFPVVPRGSIQQYNPADITNDNGRPRSPPSTPVPYPLMLLLTQHGTVVEQLDTDYLFAGMVSHFQAPTSTVAVGDRRGGMNTANSMSVRALDREDLFLSFCSQMTPSDDWEARVFRGPDLETMTEVSPVPVSAVGTLDISLVDRFAPAFANTALQTIGYHCLSSNDADDSALFVSDDYGASWDVRYFPWPSDSTGFIFELTDKLLGCIIYASEGIGEPRQALLLKSADFGLVWDLVSVVATDVQAGYNRLHPLITDTGLPASPRPMAPWVFDSRFSPRINP